MAEEDRGWGGSRGEGEMALTVMQRRRSAGKTGKMLWATKQLISLNLSTLHNATAHYRPIRHYNALLTEVY